MDRLRSLLRSVPSSGFSDGQAPSRRKYTCPNCQLEIDAAIFTVHLASCRPSDPSDDSADPRANSPQEFEWNMYNSSDSLSPDRSYEEEPLTITSRFLSQSQSIHTDSSYGDSEDSENRSEAGTETVLCPVCFVGYNQARRVPILLPECGHTLCLHCIKNIYRENALVKCPVCRAEYYDALSSFPTNVAVLELAEGRNHTKLCPEHCSEVIAFCEDHGKLLCGLCVFEHKDHKSFLLKSPQAEDYIKRVKSGLQTLEMKLETAKDAWEETCESLDTLSRSVSTSLHSHSTQLQSTESQLITQIRAGKRACIDQLKAVLEENGPEHLQNSCSVQLIRIVHDLQRLQENKANFDGLPVSEQVTTALGFKPENYPSPPSLSPIRVLSEQLNHAVDYEEAIKAAKMVTIE